MDPQEAVTFLLTKVRKTFDLLIFCPIISIKGMRIACLSRAGKKVPSSHPSRISCRASNISFSLGQGCRQVVCQVAWGKENLRAA